MTRFQQFFALFRFTARISVMWWLLTLSLSIGTVFGGFGGSYNDLRSVFTPINIYGFMLFFFAGGFFCSEVLYKKSKSGAAGNGYSDMFSEEFLITRAVDRSTVFWSRNVLYWMICVIPILAGVISGMLYPQLSLEIFNKTGQAAAKAHYYLQNIPGSYIEQTKPTGTVVIHSLKGFFYLKLAVGALLLSIAVIAQGFVLAIARFRFSRILFFAPVVMWGFSFNWVNEKNDLVERSAFWILNHPIGFLAAFIVVAVSTNFFALRKFTKLEHP